MKRTRPISMPLMALLTAIVLVGGISLWQWHQPRYQPQPKLPYLAEFGLPAQPFTILFLGDDVTYSWDGNRQVPDRSAFSGRSDTMLVLRLDPVNRSISGLQIPRDTLAEIPGFGYQKINAANSLGGPQLAKAATMDLLGIPIDHYLLLNVDGLIAAVNELDGITVDIPKRMSYMDWTAKLKIDLMPGMHTLTGNQAMGFVRFRHDELGDIGRVQRQQMFIKAFLSKLLLPTSWPHIPRLLAILHNSVTTDLSDLQLIQAFNLARSTPSEHLHLTTLPGRFGALGSWEVDRAVLSSVIDSAFGGDDLTGTQQPPAPESSRGMRLNRNILIR